MVQHYTSTHRLLFRLEKERWDHLDGSSTFMAGWFCCGVTVPPLASVRTLRAFIDEHDGVTRRPFEASVPAWGAVVGGRLAHVALGGVYAYT